MSVRVMSRRRMLGRGFDGSIGVEIGVVVGLLTDLVPILSVGRRDRESVVALAVARRALAIQGPGDMPRLAGAPRGRRRSCTSSSW